MQDGGQDGHRNPYIENLFSDKCRIHLLHITNVLCLIFSILFTVQVRDLFSSDPTMMQDGDKYGDQDGHLNHDIRENGL